MIRKYVKKPVIIEAIQCTGSNFDEVKEFCGDNLICVKLHENFIDGWYIDTLEGHSYLLSEGDYVIKGIKGEFYPCKEDVFELTYEEIINETN